MITATARIEMLAPYCQSRYHGEAKLSKELSDDYERRTWKYRLHVDEENQNLIVIPAMAFSNCLMEAAKFLSIQIPGKGKMTWTKQFEAGVAVVQNVQTGITVDQAIEKRMFVPSTGVAGDGKRVMKSYPIIVGTPSKPLTVEVEFTVTNEMITAEAFAYHLQQAGQLIGIGAFRVRNRGIYGRFKVLGIDWREHKGSAKLPPIRHFQS